MLLEHDNGYAESVRSTLKKCFSLKLSCQGHFALIFSCWLSTCCWAWGDFHRHVIIDWKGSRQEFKPTSRNSYIIVI